MLQSMRSAAKYIWVFLIVAFIGGFLLAETSGLLNQGAVTSTTAIAEVNGDEILATDYFRAVQLREQQESQRLGMYPAPHTDFISADPWTLAEILASTGTVSTFDGLLIESDPLDQVRRVRAADTDGDGT